ncbi:hypothetical protein HUT11_24590 [Streptomyces seoulensis]|nr:hypothetical protein HUT11_24590 [Streptomyces seoulensis]
MKARSLSGLVAALLVTSAAACSASSEPGIPHEICGAPIDPEIVRPLLVSTSDLHEYNRVEPRQEESAPCVLLSGRDTALAFNFYRTRDAPDASQLVSGGGSLLDIAELRSVDARHGTAVGNNGAVSTSVCEAEKTDHLTLTLQLPRIARTDRSHRGDIEKFMRAYFPATLKTLGCRTAPPASPRPGQER